MRVAHEHRVARRALRRPNRPAVGSVRIDHFLPRLAIDVLLARQPVVMNDTEAVRIHVLGGERQHAPRGRAQVLRVLRRPRVEPVGKRADQRAEFSALLRLPLLRPLRNAGGAHPSIAREVCVAVEFRASAASLRIEAHQQVRVAFHLRIPVGVEQARVIWCEDVRDAVGIPEDLSSFRGCRRRAWRDTGGHNDERDDESDTNGDGEPTGEPSHSVPPEMWCSYISPGTA